MLTSTTQAQGALFTIPTESRTSNGPVMTGNVEHNSVKTPVAAFLQVSQTSGQNYLNMRIGEKGKDSTVYYGRLFRNEKKDVNSPDYTGYIELVSKSSENRLRVAGWKTQSRDKTMWFISLEVGPPKTNADSLNQATEENLPI